MRTWHWPQRAEERASPERDPLVVVLAEVQVEAQVDENVALAAKGRGKGKSRKGPAGGGSGRGAGRGTGGGAGRGGGKDLAKVKCWHCHEMGHYAVMCPQKKRKGKDPLVAASAEIGEFAARFDQGFALMTGLVTVEPSAPP